MAPHSNTLAWKLRWTEEPGRLQSIGSLRVGHDWAKLHFHFSLSCFGEGNGNPLQCSCLENPREGEPSGLPSMGSHRVGHNWSDLAAAAAVAYPTLCDPIAYRLQSFSVHGILQARIMEWGDIPIFRDLPDSGIESWSPALQADSLSSELPGKPHCF